MRTYRCDAPVLRYADVVLVLAEAAANLGMNNEAYDAIEKVVIGGKVIKRKDLEVKE